MEAKNILTANSKILLNWPLLGLHPKIYVEVYVFITAHVLISIQAR